MEKLKNAIRECGIVLNNGVSDDDVLKIAKTLGLDPALYLPRNVKVGLYTNKTTGETNIYVKSDQYVVGTKENGKADKRRGLFHRAELIDDMIADLQKAKELIASGKVEKL